MPKATNCLLNDQQLQIDDALQLRRGMEKSPSFRCVECGKPVRAHSLGSTGQAAHFEHLEKNRNCSRSG